MRMPDVTFRDLFRPEHIDEDVWEEAVAKMDGISLGRISISDDKTHLHVLLDEDARDQFIQALKEAMGLEELDWETDPDAWKE